MDWTLVMGWNKLDSSNGMEQTFLFNGPGYYSQIGPYYWIGMDSVPSSEFKYCLLVLGRVRGLVLKI